MIKIKLSAARKFIAILANFSLLLNSFVPFLLVAAPAYAQEATPTETPVLIENTPAPENIPTPEITPIPEITPTPEITPVLEPTVTPEITPTVDPVNVEIGSLVPPSEATPSSEVVTPTPEATPTPEPVLDSSPIEITPIPEVIPTEGPVLGTTSPISVFEKVCLTDQQIKDTTNEEWITNDTTGISETKGKVQLGVRYVYPQENKVSVTFKCLPKDENLRTPLKIQKIKTAELALPDTMGSVGEYAYDITTGMTDGDFEYDVTLPKPENSTAEISYIEKSIDEAKYNLSFFDINKIDDSKVEQTGDTVKAVSIDHFTIYLTNYSKISPLGSISSFPYDCNYQCSANDVTVKSAELVKDLAGTPLTCTPGTPTTAYVKITYDNHSTDRYAVYLLGDVYEGGVYKQSIDWNATCLDHMATGLGSKILNTGFTWTCGTSLSIKNITLSWDTNTNTCSNFASQTKCNPPGQSWCNNGLEYIVTTPLVVNFTAPEVCLGQPTQFISTTTGGKLPYTNYAWDFGDISSGIGESTTHTYGVAGTYPVKLTVTDSVPQTDDQINNVSVKQCATCGDGFKNQASEECDDGAQNGTICTPPYGTNGQPASCNYCSTECKTVTLTDGYCGDNIKNGPEECDGTDGVTSGYTCSATCSLVRDSGTITIDKVTNPSGDNTSFDFRRTGDDNQTVDFSLSDQSTPASYTLPTGAYSIEERNIPSNWKLTDLSCNQSASIDLVNHKVNFNLDKNEQITCTFTNTKDATLTVIKHVDNDDGGLKNASDFTLNIGNTSFNGSETGTSFALSAGVYSVGETLLPGYTQTGNECSSVTLAAGENKTCTITNDDNAPTLTLIKSWRDTYNSGYTINDWTLSAIGTGSSLIGHGSVTGNVLAGTYTLSESGPTGTNSSVWDCTGGATPIGNILTISLGQSITCTITNTPIQPKLTVTKIVVNDNGGTKVVSDFPLYVGSLQVISGQENGFNVGNYTVSEIGQSGYSATIGGACAPNGSVTLALGDDKTCTITNDDITANLKLIKIVTNDNGGNAKISDFTLKANDTVFTSGVAQDVNAGTYTLSETNQSGYLSSSWSCVGGSQKGSSVTLTEGQSAVCTITNDDIAPKLTLVKTVNNDNGGNALPDDFKLTIGGNSATSGIAYALEANKVYAINETQLTGYDFVSITGNGCPTKLGDTITLNEGDDIICTITNDDQSPSIILIKNVLGGSATANDFGLTIRNDSVGSGETKYVDANTSIALNETGKSGYTFTSITGDQKCPSILGGTVTLNEGENIVCTITNTRDIGNIIVNKIIDQDGDLNTTNDQILGENWQFDVDGTSNDTSDPSVNFTDIGGSQVFSNLKTGQYTIIETKQTGYDLIGASCGIENGRFDQTDSVDNVNVLKDSNTVCTFYNTPNGTIHGYKWNDIDASGGLVVGIGESLLSGWTINLYKSNGDGGFDSTPIKSMITDSGNQHFGWYWFEHLFPGQYKVCEVLQSNWIQTYPINQNDNCHIVNLPDDNSNQFPNGLNYVSGHEYNFGNQQKGEVTVYKFNDLNGNGNHDENEPYLPDWDITVDQVSDGGFTQKTDENGKTVFSLTPGEYVLGETMQDGWYQSNIYCEDNSPGDFITKTGEAYGHHGNCEGWNGCGDAATCALWACEVNGYSQLVSYGAQKPCTEFNNCHLFSSRGNVDWDWGNWCPVMGVTDIKCSGRSNITPTPTPRDLGLDLKKLFKVKEVQAQSASSDKVVIQPGQNKTCYIGNYQKATVTVNKDVLDHLGQPLDDNYSFTVSISGIGQTNFSELSPAVFKLNPGTYTLSEINIDPKYQLKSNNDIEITVTSGESKSVNFINWSVPPKLTISKTNNRWPVAQTNGSEVEYTITLNVQDNDVKGVSVIDLPPYGFTYKTGSWKVLVNGTERSITEPVYHSPGTWQIGDLNKDDVVTLKYIATIDNSVDPGLYKDAAWAYGCEKSQVCGLESSDRLLASAVIPGKLNTTFVGTQIKIDPVLASQDINLVKEEGQVLGASTEMPATGPDTIWAVIFSLLSSIGLGFIIFGFKTKGKKNMKDLIIILFICLASVLSVKSVNAVQSSNIFISVENPISPTNKDKFSLSFTALDILNRPLIVKCFKVNPDSSEVQIGADVAVKAGGNSGECSLENYPLTENGKTYYFYAIASAGADQYRSDSVPVDYNSIGPGTPYDYSKEKQSNCNYKISFRASSDGKTNAIKIYRSELTKFTADIYSQVGKVDISPDEKGSYLDTSATDCNKTYYYVIRAFDEAGNGSGLAGDFVTVYISTTTPTIIRTSGAIPLIGENNIPAETTITPTEVTSPIQPPESGEVLGSETSNPKSFANQLQSFISRHKYSISLTALILLIIIGYGIKKAREKKN